MNKHTLSALLAALLLTTPVSAWAAGSATTTQAAPSDSEEQAVIAKARALLGGLKDLPQAQATATFQQDARSFWTVLFAKGDPLVAQQKLFDEQVDFVHVMLDAETMEPFYLFQERADWKVETGQPLHAKARKVADAFIASTLPHLAKTMMFREVFPFGEHSAVVSYMESVNGIPNPANYLSIHVDGDGHVLTMSTVTGNASSQLPPASEAVSLETAQERFLADFALDHYYRLQNRTLLYKPIDLPAIDAATGDYVAPKPETLRPPIQRTGEGWQTVAYSPMEARNIYARLTGLKPSALKLEKETVPNAVDGIDWQLQWGRHLAQFYAGSYQLKMLVSPQRTPADAKSAFSLEEGREKALRYLQRVLPAGEHLLYPVAEMDLGVPRPNPKYEGEFLETQPRMAFLFAGSHQGVKVLDYTYSVEIDSVTSDLLYLELPAQADFSQLPDASQAVDKDAVLADYLKTHPLELSYDRDGRLIYQTVPSLADHGFSINALTGKKDYE